MISVMVWVFFMVGDSLVSGEPPAYEQQIVSRYTHDYGPERVEEECAQDFHAKYPHHVICESGWCQQEVRMWPV